MTPVSASLFRLQLNAPNAPAALFRRLSPQRKSRLVSASCRLTTAVERSTLEMKQRVLPLLNDQPWAERSQPDGAPRTSAEGRGTSKIVWAGLSLHHENGEYLNIDTCERHSIFISLLHTRATITFQNLRIGAYSIYP